MKKTIFLTSIILATALVGCNRYGSISEARTEMGKWLAKGKTYEYKAIVSEFRNTPRAKEDIEAEQKNKEEQCLSRQNIINRAYLKCDYFLINTEISGYVDVEGTSKMLSRLCIQEEETKQFVCSDADKPDKNRVYAKGHTFSYDKNYRYFRY